MKKLSPLRLIARLCCAAAIAAPAGAWAGDTPSMSRIRSPLLEDRVPTVSSASHASYQIGEVALRLNRLPVAGAVTLFDRTVEEIEIRYERDFPAARVAAGPLRAGPVGRYTFLLLGSAEGLVISITAAATNGDPSPAAAELIGRIACSTTFEGNGLPCALK